MDRLNKIHHIIEKILREYAALPYTYDDLKHQLIISSDRHHYLLMTIGWENGIKVHGCLVHLEIIGNKIWIHRDGLEDGIANDLIDAGIGKEEIVLAFHPPEIRPHTGFAVS